MLVKSAKSLPAAKGINKAKLGTVRREDGGLQLTIGGWPMYRYTGDEKPGDWEGQGDGGTWFVVTKDGKKNLKLIQEASSGDESAEEDAGDSGGSGEDYGDGGSGGY